jgi:hypothetical protein
MCMTAPPWLLTKAGLQLGCHAQPVACHAEPAEAPLVTLQPVRSVTLSLWLVTLSVESSSVAL